ncbi:MULTISPECIES: hypothetical protein [unclassified Pseudoclavibacter]|uniref:hypothetical protein n=1 Tax=unclassified Pseudoclavibacter TaxID=2615177 RepID=UPI0015E3E25C|nr:MULTISPECIES: hypothetical protein [unclassified Pseudoclavibacter]
MLSSLDVPASTVSKIEQTRALDGRQDDSWDDLEASWTYHPDDGLNIVFEYEDADESS